MGSDQSKSAEQETGAKKQTQLKKYVDQVEQEEISDTEEQGDEVDGAPTDYDEIAGNPDPNRFREAYLKNHPDLEEADLAALKINPATLHYPFENMIMEGGGNKGLAYVGALKVFEDLGMMDQIKRFGGTSAGAITAALVAFGYTSDEVLAFLSDNIEEVFLDHSCGYLSLIPNILNSFGWNPGKKIHDWFGNAISAKTGNPDTTFRELYKLRGVELCVVVTNLNMKTAEYCHPKTTPNMPVRDALRMTMAIPGVFSAFSYDNHGQEDLYVDGGVLVNYAINCFDGWFLSMEKDDSFLLKIKSLKDVNTLMANRFEARGPNKTVGFLLFDDAETEIMRFSLEKRIGTLVPEKPKVETELYLAKQEKMKVKKKTERAHTKVVQAAESFFAAVHKHNVYDQEYISKDELQAVLNDELFPEKDRILLFGKDCNLDQAFQLLDRDDNGRISFFELMQFIGERGIRMQVRVQGYGRREIGSFASFLLALQDSLLTNLKFLAVTNKDEVRTVGINTGHVGTTDYTLEEPDREFVVQRGYNSTMSFLRYYAAKNPDLVKKGKSPVQDQQPTSIHS